jgi:hypothetical protein
MEDGANAECACAGLGLHAAAAGWVGGCRHGWLLPAAGAPRRPAGLSGRQPASCRLLAAGS